MYQPGVNSINLRQLFPRASGQTTSEEASSAAPARTGSPRANDEVSQAAQIGASGSPLLALGVMAVLLFVLMFVARRIGSEGATFASIKLSVYNVLVISLAAIIGINFFKLVFTRIKLPGVSAAVLAA